MGIVYGQSKKAIWRIFGGTGYATWGSNISVSSLFANKSIYNNDLIMPFDRSGGMACEISEELYHQWSNRKNVTWYKRIRSYNADGTPYTADNRIHADVFLKFTGDATFEKVMASVNGGYTDLGGYVYMNFYVGTNRTFYDYGRTKYAYSSGTTSIGFANNTDSGVPAGEEVMGNNISLYNSAGWEARHVISYNHTTTGRDVTRCQFLCWGNITGVTEEVTWYAGYN